MTKIDYDSFYIYIEEREDHSLICFIEYYKNHQIVEKKRTTNVDFINKILSTTINYKKNIKYINGNLVSKYQQNGTISIRNYEKLRDRKEFKQFNKIISITSKKTKTTEKRIPNPVKNLKVTQTDTKLKRIKWKKNVAAAITFSAITISQLIPALRDLPDYHINMQKESNVQKIEENFSANNSIMEIQKIVNSNLSKEIITETGNTIGQTIYNKDELSLLTGQNSSKIFFSIDPEYNETVEIIKMNDHNSENISYKNLSEEDYQIFLSKPYSLTEEQKLEVKAIIAGEDSYSYEGALAVWTTVLNRCDTIKWQEYGGDNPYKQLTFSGQFVAKDGDLTAYYLKHPEAIPPYVTAAVEDGLNGYRNHEFTSFNANPASNRVQIGEKGNYYYDKSNSIPNYGYVNNSKTR